MPNPLPADLQSKIEKDAEEYWMIKRQYNHHPKHYYIEGATAYAHYKEEAERYRKALEDVSEKISRYKSLHYINQGLGIIATALGQQGKGGEDHGK
jgi:hypothetical protein